MNITIYGCGNIGTQFAVHCADKGHRVKMFGSRPEAISSRLTIVNEQGKTVRQGELVCATNEPQQAFQDADMIFVTVPAYCMKGAAEKILPWVHEGQIIGLVPGTGGGECAFYECIRRGAVVFGLQRVPSVARLVEYGKTVCASGYRANLFAAAIPHRYAPMCCGLVTGIFDMPCHEMPNYLNVTLTPSNPILHTTRLRTIFRDFREGVTYENVPLFYEQWDDASSELLLLCDEEVQQICRALPELDLSYVRSLREHYESDTVQAMTRKITSIPSLQGLKTPTAMIQGGQIPDLNSRYFTADFPFGLEILVQIAAFAGIHVPHMEQTLAWYHEICTDHVGFRYADYGITDREKFLRFYAQ